MFGSPTGHAGFAISAAVVAAAASAVEAPPTAAEFIEEAEVQIIALLNESIEHYREKAAEFERYGVRENEQTERMRQAAIKMATTSAEQAKTIETRIRLYVPPGLEPSRFGGGLSPESHPWADALIEIESQQGQPAASRIRMLVQRAVRANPDHPKANLLYCVTYPRKSVFETIPRDAHRKAVELNPSETTLAWSYASNWYEEDAPFILGILERLEAEDGRWREVYRFRAVLAWANYFTDPSSGLDDLLAFASGDERNAFNRFDYSRICWLLVEEGRAEDAEVLFDQSELAATNDIQSLAGAYALRAAILASLGRASEVSALISELERRLAVSDEELLGLDRLGTNFSERARTNLRNETARIWKEEGRAETVRKDVQNTIRIMRTHLTRE